ncbi:hypothetical protein BDV95DRAFT_591004 [Massariosphaeria phaeospora]|uniref:protein-tyrosine-phosphatase n=1 Tax=Massariosphaeria phaeospora TaxID=100035 RepID=A0A7C8MDE7_9PLEO|nr:hypothetical protein BDV95DRAFT_591004 [Massariosphaeria phaeospora]
MPLRCSPLGAGRRRLQLSPSPVPSRVAQVSPAVLPVLNHPHRRCADAPLPPPPPPLSPPPRRHWIDIASDSPTSLPAPSWSPSLPTLGLRRAVALSAHGTLERLPDRSPSPSPSASLCAPDAVSFAFPSPAVLCAASQEQAHRLTSRSLLLWRLIEDLVFSFQTQQRTAAAVGQLLQRARASNLPYSLSMPILTARPDCHSVMATSPNIQKANSPTLKRAHPTPNTTFPCKKPEHTFSHQPTRPCSAPHPLHSSSSTGNRSPRSGQQQRPVRPRRYSMVHASSRTFVPMQSFGSVFGEGINNSGFTDISARSGTGAHGSTVGRPASSGNTTNGVPFSSFHIHHDSRDSTSSASSDNSPTTTISTMDSSSVTDPSPGPSPESPIAKVAASSFVADFRSRRTETNTSDPSPTTFFELQRPTTPAKKPRNLKNLGINTASSLGNLRANPTALLPLVAKERNSSAPPSPSFIKPPTPPKRRPSNLSLTISTPGSNETKPMKLVIPATPALNRPGLRHFQSSPSLPLCSPSVVPKGGMQLPSLRAIKPNPHGFSEVPFEMEEEDQEPNFDIPQSREEKPAAYPNGPICIYESGVYLYFEPTVDQAVAFDVIMNVASEVKNPFTSPASVTQKDLDARRLDGPPAESVDFASLPERPKPSSFDTQGSSPTTPKATPILETMLPTEHVVAGTTHKTPEYIHMLWEHNTDIVPDLYKLVKTMDERVQQGKRILVHCQCGVSRSASLIVAYGLYKNPGMSVQEAYDSVKKRSKWIGPNMNLIMQLQEFRNGLLRANESRSYNQAYGLNLPRRSAGLPSAVSTGTNRHSPFDRDDTPTSRTPRTAPLPPESDMSMQRASTGNIMSISPGPLSAPSGSSMFSPGFRRSWTPSQTHFDMSPKDAPAPTPYVDPKGHLVPVLSVTENDLPAPTQDATRKESTEQSLEEENLKQLPVPNFSRQLPLRQLEANDESSQSTLYPRTIDFNTTILGTNGLKPLRTPAVSSFSMALRAPGHSNSSELLSPRKTEFNLSPWPRGDDLEYQRSPRFDKFPTLDPVSPTSSGFQISESHEERMDSSPPTRAFGLGPPQGNTLATESERSFEPLDILSPTATEFPKDIFLQANDMADEEMSSPRAEEFHMTPLKPSLADADPFGLTSPTRFGFTSNPFRPSDITALQNEELDPRRPSFQAILPPSHLAQPEAVNGFTSLNSTAQILPIIQVPKPLPELEAFKSADSTERMDSLDVSPNQYTESTDESQSPTVRSTCKKTSETPRNREQLFLSTPARQTAIRTRFSSPNMREQKKLHKLQTEMEAMLPLLPQAADDLDALLSPRAEEFTRNPFHMDLRSSGDNTSPVSSNETVKDGHSGTDWKDASQRTPQKLEADPRSPVQTGSSPITTCNLFLRPLATGGLPGLDILSYGKPTLPVYLFRVAAPQPDNIFRSHRQDGNMVGVHSQSPSREGSILHVIPGGPGSCAATNTRAVPL